MLRDGHRMGKRNNNEPKQTVAVSYYIFVARAGMEFHCKVSGDQVERVLL